MTRHFLSFNRSSLYSLALALSLAFISHKCMRSTHRCVYLSIIKKKITAAFEMFIYTISWNVCVWIYIYSSFFFYSFRFFLLYIRLFFIIFGVSFHWRKFPYALYLRCDVIVVYADAPKMHTNSIYFEEKLCESWNIMNVRGCVCVCVRVKIGTECNEKTTNRNEWSLLLKPFRKMLLVKKISQKYIHLNWFAASTCWMHFEWFFNGRNVISLFSLYLFRIENLMRNL